MKILGNEVELLILDVDGVLLEIRESLERNLLSVARQLSLPLEPIPVYMARLRAGILHGKEDDSTRDRVNFMWPSHPEEVRERFIKLARAERDDHPLPPIPGSREALEQLHQAGLKLALCTSRLRKPICSGLEAAGISPDLFSAMSTQEHGFLKPHPRCFDPIFNALQVPRERALFIGDWIPDIRAAERTGVPFAGVTSGLLTEDVLIKEGVPQERIIPSLAHLANTLVAIPY